MKAYGRKKLLCSKKLPCGIMEKFSVICASADYDSAKRKYEAMGYTVY